MPEGLSGLEAVEGEDVVLPAWYTFEGERAAAKVKPWEVLTLMWFLEQKGKDKKQVREERAQLRPAGVGVEGEVDQVGQWGGDGAGKQRGQEKLWEKPGPPQWFNFVCILEASQKNSLSPNFP